LFNLLLIVHVFICVGLIIVVLMQSSKGEGLAGAFGGGSLTGAVFGGRGAASFLSKATTILAVLFMVSCLGLSLISAGGKTSSSTTATPASAVSQAAQKDMAAQQQQQQQAGQTQPGQTQPATNNQSAQDIFNQSTATPKDSGK
jgi:preprotein translocase subunit SecG